MTELSEAGIRTAILSSGTGRAQGCCKINRLDTLARSGKSLVKVVREAMRRRGCVGYRVEKDIDINSPLIDVMAHK